MTDKNVFIDRSPERTFKSGALLFIQGESGAGMFIIKSGKVRVFKQEDERAEKWQVLGPGSVLGEISLIHGRPYAFSAQAMEPVTALVIQKKDLDHTISRMPGWFVHAFQSSVTKLRGQDDTKRKSSLKTRLPGLMRILLLLKERCAAEPGRNSTVPLPVLKEKAELILGLSFADSEEMLIHLVLKGFLAIEESDSGEEYVRLLHSSALRYYMTYLRVKRNGGVMAGESLSDTAFELGNLILAVAKKKGAPQKNGMIRLEMIQLINRLKEEKKTEYMQAGYLNEISNTGALKLTGEVSAGGSIISFDEKKLRSILFFRAFLPAFQKEAAV